jgi:hypothetical protein
MPNPRFAKTSFTAGELSPALLGRYDLAAYATGAARLRNVVIRPTGGVSRRPGLRHVDTLPAAARLVPFAFNTEQDYLLAIGAGSMRVYRNDVLMATVATPWTAEQLDRLAWTQNADTLIVCHPDVPPQRITRTGHAAWTVAPFAFDTDPVSKAPQDPFYRHAPAAMTMQAANTSGTVTVVSSAPYFTAAHVGLMIRIAKKAMRIQSITDSMHAAATVLETLTTTAATVDWDEQAFSPLHGWPATAVFHQSRLVFGGSRDLPNRIWMSRTADIANFSLGTGLDDQGIEFGLLADQINAVCALHSGRHLQVFTAGAEWMIAGDPLTPGTAQARRQTRIGAPVERHVPTVTVDNATIFAAAGGLALHEFSYTDLDAAYIAPNLAQLAQHLVTGVLDLAFDARRRLILAPVSDGTVAALTLMRSEQITGWTRLDTDGAVRRVAVAGDDAYVLVQRAGTWRIERLDENCNTDGCLSGTAAAATTRWSGLDHLEGCTVRAVADGSDIGTLTVRNGAVTLPAPAVALEAGLPFTHEIVPLPLALSPMEGAAAGPMRLVRARFRVEATAALSADTGRGLAPVPLARFGRGLLDAPPVRFSGDCELRGMGWVTQPGQPLWRVASDAPLPCTVLSVMTEVKGDE